jgi:hypothetical protein
MFHIFFHWVTYLHLGHGQSFSTLSDRFGNVWKWIKKTKYDNRHPIDALDTADFSLSRNFIKNLFVSEFISKLETMTSIFAQNLSELEYLSIDHTFYSVGNIQTLSQG